MEYMIKTIYKDQIEDFLLNPMERMACFQRCVLQKYPYDVDIDHVIRIDRWSHSRSEAFVLYKNKLVILDECYEDDVFLPKRDSFRTTEEQRELLRSAIYHQLIEMTEEKKKTFRSIPELNDAYKEVKNFYFDRLVAVLLGAENFEFNQLNIMYEESKRIVRSFDFKDLAKATADPNYYNRFLQNALENEAFIRDEVFLPEVLKEARTYYKAGVFTKRDQMLIDFINKTKSCGAKELTVVGNSGESYICANTITSERFIPLKIDANHGIYLDFIDSVHYDGKTIYKKTI